MFPNNYICLDGTPLSQGELVEVVGDYVGSEVVHYTGEQGHVVDVWVNQFKLPIVVVYLNRLRVNVELYPYELIHQYT